MFRYILPVLVPCLFLIGCSGGAKRPEGMPPLCSCDITILQDGNPLAECSVTMVPLDETNKWGSGGMTDARGQIKPMTYGKFAGVPEGKYKILVAKILAENEPPPLPMDATPEQQKEYDQNIRKNPPQSFDLVDTKFKTAATTPLEMNVEKGGKNDFSFDVGAAVKIPIKSAL